MIEELRRKCPYLFLIIIVFVLIFEYFVHLKLVWLDLNPSSTFGIVVYLLIYHTLLFMLLWSLVKTMISQPGQVPTYWGYYLGEDDNRVKKLCLKCFVYKPERSHHCSTCNKCILNMDHHCPWINNCVGFYNRKPFILMLIYTTLLTLVQLVGTLVAFPALIRHLKSTSSVGSYVSAIMILVAFILNIVILGTIINFLKFHIELILKNSTTLETLQSKKSGRARADLPNYDIGAYYNWIQVFGKNYWHWPFPMFFEGEGPVGDGTVWPKKSDHFQI